ncbi:PA1414 family protein [Pseudomonas sp. TMP9]
MNAKLQNALHDLLVALGLREPPTLQPIPIRNDKPAPQPAGRRRR